MTAIWDCIIVGGGCAGMAAAHRLAVEHTTTNNNNEYSILIVEATDHLGGRTRNYDLERKTYDTFRTTTGDISEHIVELGGTWLSPDHTATIRLCEDHLGLSVFRASHLAVVPSGKKSSTSSSKDAMPWWFWGIDYSDPEMNRLHKIILHRETTTTTTATINPTTFQSPKELLDALDEETLCELQTLKTKVIDPDCERMEKDPRQNVWELNEVLPGWKELDAHSTGDRVHPWLTTPNARNIFRNAIHSMNAEEPEAVGYLYNLISFRGSNSSGPDTEYRVKGGTQAIPLRIAEKLSSRSNCQILLEEPVQTIAQDESSSSWVVTTAKGRQFVGKTLLVTGSPKAIQETIDLKAALPTVQRELIASMPMGKCVKFIAVYSSPWWRNHDLQGDILSCGGLPQDLTLTNPSGDSIPLFPYCFDVSPPSKYGALACFLEGYTHEYFMGFSQEEQEDLMTEFLRVSFEPFVAAETVWIPDCFVVGDWGPETPYVGGAYTGYFPPKILTEPSHWEAYRKTEKSHRLFWAGADYHAGFGNGYIEGAIRSGQSSADKIRRVLEDDDPTTTSSLCAIQ